MKIIRFLVTNLSDGGVLTYSSQDAGFPATNIRQRWHTRCWRSSDGSLLNQFLKWDFGADKDIKAFFLRYNNFQAGATVRIQGHGSDSWTNPSYNALLAVNNRIIPHFPLSTQSFRWWRLLMSDAGNPDNHLKVGRVYLGEYVESDKNFNRKYKVKFVDPSVLTVSEGGQISSIKREKYKAWGYNFSEISKNTMEKFRDMFSELGITGNLFLCQDADDAQDSSYYIRFAKDLDWEHQFMDKYYNIKIVVEELR